MVGFRKLIDNTNLGETWLSQTHCFPGGSSYTDLDPLAVDVPCVRPGPLRPRDTCTGPGLRLRVRLLRSGVRQVFPHPSLLRLSPCVWDWLGHFFTIRQSDGIGMRHELTEPPKTASEKIRSGCSRRKLNEWILTKVTLTEDRWRLNNEQTRIGTQARLRPYSRSLVTGVSSFDTNPGGPYYYHPLFLRVLFLSFLCHSMGLEFRFSYDNCKIKTLCLLKVGRVFIVTPGVFRRTSCTPLFFSVVFFHYRPRSDPTPRPTVSVGGESRGFDPVTKGTGVQVWLVDH